eukprot:755671-Hanusia_phi.AAC.1
MHHLTGFPKDMKDTGREEESMDMVNGRVLQNNLPKSFAGTYIYAGGGKYVGDFSDDKRKATRELKTN